MADQPTNPRRPRAQRATPPQATNLPIDAIPIAAPHVPRPFDPDAPFDIDAIPIAPVTITGSIDEIINYKPRDESGSEVTAMRVPLQWLAIIEEIIAHRRWPLKKRGEFLRWATWKGIEAATAYLKTLVQEGDDAEMDYSDLDATTQAYVFSDRIMGMSNARTAMIERIQKQVRNIVIAAKVSMDIGDKDNAAELIMFYVENALKLQGFWLTFSIHTLLADMEGREVISELIRAGKISNEYLIGAAQSFGAIGQLPQRDDGDVTEDFNAGGTQ